MLKKTDFNPIPGDKGEIVIVTKVSMDYELFPIHNRLTQSGYKPFYIRSTTAGGYYLARAAVKDDPDKIRTTYEQFMDCPNEH